MTNHITDVAQGDVEISQHIGWLKQYLAGMTEHNWRDMRMLAGRQLDALAAAQSLSAVAQSAQVADAIKVIRTEPCPFEDNTDMAYGWFEAAATFLNRLGVDTDSPTTAQPPAAPVEIDVLSRLVDWTYLHATEGEVWPSSKTKADLITRARQDAPRQKHADAMKALPRSSAGNADETAPGQSLLECRDFIAALIGGAPFEGRAIEHARELIQNADTALATFNEPQTAPVSAASDPVVGPNVQTVDFDNNSGADAAWHKIQDQIDEWAQQTLPPDHALAIMSWSDRLAQHLTVTTTEPGGAEHRARRETQAEILSALLREARQYVSDAGSDEDGETQSHSTALLSAIDTALSLSRQTEGK